MPVASEARRKQQQLDFRLRLKRALDAKEWTQKDLARRLGVAESSVTGWLRHGALPGADILFELPYVLGVSADWLLVGRGEQRPPTTQEAPDTRYLEGGRTALNEARRELDDLLRELGSRWDGRVVDADVSRRAARLLAQEEQESREIRTQPEGMGRRRRAQRKAQ
jgi:transcriptional regulator with XRE-family HTH domain